jgi:hypothetical protein
MTDTLRLQRWQVGDAQVTRIEEQLGPGSFPPAKYFDGFEPEVLQRHLDWLVPHHYLPAQDALVTSVHSWLVQTPRLTVLVDGCSGNHKDRHWWPRFHMLDTPFLQRLTTSAGTPSCATAAGCRPSRTRATCSRAPSASTGTRGATPAAPTRTG